MSIPAVEPPVAPGTPASLRPGTKTSRLTGAIDDSAGSGYVIPLNAVDDAYVDWRMQGLDGWDSADLPEGAEDKVGEDGSWDAPNYYSGRIVTISGLLTAPTYEAREVAEEQLRRAVPPRRRVMLRINETIPKYVIGRRSGRVMITPLDEVHSKWQVALLCPDPRKYGFDVATEYMSIALPAPGLAPPWTPPIVMPARPPGTNTATITNAGAYESQPLIRIDGPGRAPQIINDTTGLFLAYDLELGVGDYLLIDCHAGVALLQGVAPRAPVAGSAVTKLFVITPGPNKLRFVATPTDPDLVALATVQCTPAWD